MESMTEYPNSVTTCHPLLPSGGVFVALMTVDSLLWTEAPTRIPLQMNPVCDTTHFFEGGLRQAATCGSEKNPGAIDSRESPDDGGSLGAFEFSGMEHVRH